MPLTENWDARVEHLRDLTGDRELRAAGFGAEPTVFKSAEALRAHLTILGQAWGWWEFTDAVVCLAEPGPMPDRGPLLAADFVAGGVSFSVRSTGLRWTLIRYTDRPAAPGSVIVRQARLTRAGVAFAGRKLVYETCYSLWPGGSAEAVLKPVCCRLVELEGGAR